MDLTLYAHPFSAYSQKVAIALYENETPFAYRNIEQPEAAAERAALWPLGRFPVLKDDCRMVAESSIIIEYLGLHYPGPVKLLPAKADAALEVRFMDRFFDNYIMTPTQAPVHEALRQADGRKDAAMVETAGGDPFRSSENKLHPVAGHQ